METQNKPSIAFSGNIPRYYDLYLGPMFFEPYARYMASKIETIAPNRILELASGTGRLTKLLPTITNDNAEIIASDINPAMVSFGEENIKHDKIKWLQVDAVSLPFEDESFDCVVVQFGVMFYSDRIKAYQEAKRVLKPGGTFIFATWDDIQFNAMPLITKETLEYFFPVDTPAFYSVPFSYFDKKQINSDLTEAGFSNIKTETKQLKGFSASAHDAAKGLIQGTPTVTAIEERDAEKLPLILDNLLNKITQKFGTSTLEVPLQAIVVSSTKN